MVLWVVVLSLFFLLLLNIVHVMYCMRISTMMHIICDKVQSLTIREFQWSDALIVGHEQLVITDATPQKNKIIDLTLCPMWCCNTKLKMQACCYFFLYHIPNGAKQSVGAMAWRIGCWGCQGKMAQIFLLRWWFFIHCGPQQSYVVSCPHQDWQFLQYRHLHCIQSIGWNQCQYWGSEKAVAVVCAGGEGSGCRVWSSIIDGKVITITVLSINTTASPIYATVHISENSNACLLAPNNPTTRIVTTETPTSSPLAYPKTSSLYTALPDEENYFL